MTKGTCSFLGCGKTVHGDDLCHGHYMQDWRGQPLTPLRTVRPKSTDPIDWFLQGFDTSGGPDSCHEWQRSRKMGGYGQIKIMGQVLETHVLIWMQANGPVPDGLVVRHIVCDNPPCGNIAHLLLGTPAENSADMVAKGRQARGERSGTAKLTGPQVLGILLRLQGGESQRSIAARYGVSRESIAAIASGRNWSHYST